MAHQAADHRQQRRVRLLPQSQRHLKVSLAGSLSGHVVGAVVDGDSHIMGRVVGGHVNAVQYAVQLIADGVHDGGHAVGIVIVVKLGGIGGADGGDRVGHQHGGLHEIHVAVHLQRAVVPPALVQTEKVGHGVGAVAALILDIMDGEHGFDTPHRVPAGGNVLEIDGHQRRLPVVAVNHIRHPVQTGQQIHHRLAEKGEAFAVVILAVQPAPAEIVLVIHEIPRHAPILHDEQAAVLVPPCHVHIDIAAVDHPLPPLVGDLIIQWQDHRHLIAVLGQRYRQTAGHVRKTARLAEGKRLTGGKQYFHKSSSSL